MAMAVALLVLLFAAVPAVYGTQHIVGGSSGWTEGVVDYATWAASQHFLVGDTLLFTYSSTHGVVEVSQDDYANCNTDNPINSYFTGNTLITLTQVGTRYFICASSGHCAAGMKLAVTTVATTASNNILAPPPPPGTYLYSNAAVGDSCNAINLMSGLLLIFSIVFERMG